MVLTSEEVNLILTSLMMRAQHENDVYKALSKPDLFEPLESKESIELRKKTAKQAEVLADKVYLWAKAVVKENKVRKDD